MRVSRATWSLGLCLCLWHLCWEEGGAAHELGCVSGRVWGRRRAQSPHESQCLLGGCPPPSPSGPGHDLDKPPFQTGDARVRILRGDGTHTRLLSVASLSCDDARSCEKGFLPRVGWGWGGTHTPFLLPGQTWLIDPRTLSSELGGKLPGTPGGYFAKEEARGRGISEGQSTLPQPRP